ncbi:MAG: hypothetical protein ACRDGQ_01720, partial [Candidatus Limnocylindrales bacterium]
ERDGQPDCRLRGMAGSRTRYGMGTLMGSYEARMLAKAEYEDQQMAHRPKPEPRWRWWLGAAVEMAVLVFLVLVAVALASLAPGA